MHAAASPSNSDALLLPSTLNWSFFSATDPINRCQPSAVVTVTGESQRSHAALL